MTDIKTIEQLVDFFGGDTALADMLGISQPAVAQWKSRGHIGSGWHLRLYAEIRRKGATVEPSVFGLTREEAAGLLDDDDPPRPWAPPQAAVA
jgi:hypothetical protein